MKTARPFRPRVFIVFRVSQILENNKNCLVNSLVNSIVLACLETLVKHSHSFMKYYMKHDNLKKLKLSSWTSTGGRHFVDDEMGGPMQLRK